MMRDVTRRTFLRGAVAGTASLTVARAVDLQAESAEAVRIELLDASGKALAAADAQGGTATLTADRTYAKGDRIRISGPAHLVIHLDEHLPETAVYSPTGRVDFTIPHGRKRAQERRAWPPKAFEGKRHVITARAAEPKEIAAERNVALNPCDVRGETTFYPHATSNSECRKQAEFAARNAIDGDGRNTKHGGWPFQSWGPDKRTDLWWRVEFGRPVAVDQLVLTIRADFPHDRHWHKGVIVFSDGSREAISIEKTAEAQTFAFTKRTVESLKITDLVQAEPLGWCALSEVDVRGVDVPPKRK
jgi:hypothetical protein